jgi:hypothetical protein
MGTLLKVFLLRVEPDGRVFYSEAEPEPEDAAEDDHEPSRHRGLRGWAEARFQRLKSGWQHSQSGAVRLTRRAWEWLHRRTHPDEVLLARLRKATEIEVHHPPSLSADDVAAAWSAFLARGRRRHWPWFIVNTLIAPLTILLGPLPGPNVIGYWFAYRAFHHLFILLGLGRARSGRVATRFRPADALEPPLRPPADHAELAARLAPLGCDPAALAEFLERQGVIRPPGPEVGAAPRG